MNMTYSIIIYWNCQYSVLLVNLIANRFVKVYQHPLKHHSKIVPCVELKNLSQGYRNLAHETICQTVLSFCCT